MERNAYDDKDPARVGVVRDRPEERTLVHARLCEKRGARLVHDQEDLPQSIVIPAVSTKRPRWIPGNTHNKDAVNRAGLHEQGERIHHPRLVLTAAEAFAKQSPMCPVSLQVSYGNA